MSTMFALGIMLAVLSTTGCGSLKVNVDILDPAVLIQSGERSLVATGVPKLSAATDEAIAEGVELLQKAHREVYKGLAIKQEAAARNLSGSAAAGLIAIARSQMTSFERLKGPYYSDLGRDLKRYRNDLKAALGTSYSVAPGDANYRQVLDILQQWQQRVRQTREVIDNDIGKLGRLPDPPADSLVVIQTLKEAAAADVRSGIAQVSIQNSPYAYYVANALPEAWKPYNEVYSTGRFGATDVAIKLDPDTGNYLLKGLSFDPSDVAAVASKVATQALLLSAQVAGVPVKTSSSPAEGTAGKELAARSSALVDAQASLETRRAQEEARKAALLAIANTILNEEKEIGGDDERRRAAVLAIRSAFDTRSAILRLAPANP